MDELLPLIPYGATEISAIISVVNQNDIWTYFHGGLPVFRHDANDKKAFKMITSSFINQGLCRNIDIQKSFNVSKTSIIRNCKRFKKDGPAAFYNPIKRSSNASVLTKEKIIEIEELFELGLKRSEIAKETGIRHCTISKAIQQGRIVEKKKSKIVPLSNKSERSRIDAEAGKEIGVACTRTTERAFAAFNIFNTAESRFETCYDVTNGGVLTALPALIENGLYHEINKTFSEFNGYYSVVQVLTLLAFMALIRIKTPEQLRWQSPGEIGKLLGLDRCPEVKCLREKMSVLSQDGAAEKWGEQLSQKWMNDNPDFAGVLYVDGHVRLYDGKENVPKQFVSRQRLCLKGFMDFWVNDRLGQPFFVVRQAVNHGMLEALRNDIVPRLLKEVPGQPSKKEIEIDINLHRFIIVFDREGYSPEFFKEMWTQHRIACITYNKYPGEDWEENEFKKTKVKLVGGEITSMDLAKKEKIIGTKEAKIKVDEIRKLTKNKHQTSIISTAYKLDMDFTAAFMFTRWCQEAFFGYMMEHFAIDLLSEYTKVDVPDTEKVISPEWRCLEKEKNSLNGKVKSKKSRFSDFVLKPMEPTGTKKYKKWEKAKAEFAEEIKILEEKLKIVKVRQKEKNKYIEISDLPEEELFQQIASDKKNISDSIKMISYRAETAMAGLIVDDFGRLNQARALVRNVFSSEADLFPDTKAGKLIIRLHNLSTCGLDKKLDKLLQHLNDSKMKFPGTNMELVYERIGSEKVSSKLPAGQDF